MPTIKPRHSFVVRVTHWLTVASFAALLVSGCEIVLSHPRFYWGETGNVMMKPLFNLHLPTSRESIPNGYNFTLPDQNGWSRALHFEMAWLLGLTALVYVLAGIWNGHFRRNLVPRRGERNLRTVWGLLVGFLHNPFRHNSDEDTYNALQRIVYLFVVFILFPLILWTGLAMSNAFNAAFPLPVALLGGRQTARTLHFFDTIALVLFLFVHLFMITVSGFKNKVWGMIAGVQWTPKERK